MSDAVLFEKRVDGWIGGRWFVYLWVDWKYDRLPTRDDLTNPSMPRQSAMQLVLFAGGGRRWAKRQAKRIRRSRKRHPDVFSEILS